ncbi:MAG: hypothetical protein IPK60_02290 [Sandaracinaceae bacterium]|nr:hypothetical protein [Sandaracinaceae bacterium]
MSLSSNRIFSVFALSLGLLVGCSNSRATTNPCDGFEVQCPNSAGLATCTPVNIDPNNCGACGNVCAIGQTCLSGSCSGTPADGGGVDSGIARDAGTSSGSCSPSCSSSERCCGTDCVSRSVTAGTNGRTDSSFMNCNGCGLACNETTASACSVAGSGAPRCVCGTSPACTGSRQCVASGSTFACVDMGSDPLNCGAVGNACDIEEICVSGVCTCGSTVCGEDSTCCGGSCISTTSDNANCGGCGTACGAGTTCSDSMCRCGTEVCTTGSAASLGQLCCDSHCVANDDSHCGGCDTACDTESMLSCVWGTDLITMGAAHVCCGIDLGPLGGGSPICTDIGGGLPGF